MTSVAVCCSDECWQQCRIYAVDYGHAATHRARQPARFRPRASDGICVSSAGGSVDVNVDTVTGANYIGIQAINSNSGDLTITATGQVTVRIGPRSRQRTIRGRVTSSSTSTPSMAAGAACEARQFGTGALEITSTGTINSVWDGVVAETEAQATGGITINVNEIIAVGAGGNNAGIYAVDRGTGDTSITATGKVSSEQGHGIYALNTASAGAITVNVADVWEAITASSSMRAMAPVAWISSSSGSSDRCQLWHRGCQFKSGQPDGYVDRPGCRHRLGMRSRRQTIGERATLSSRSTDLDAGRRG